MADYTDGVRIKWGKLATTIVGASLIAYFEGIAAVILSLANVPIGLASGATDWVVAMIDSLLGIPIGGIWAAWYAAVPTVTDAGILAYALALAIGLGALYSIAEVVSRV